MWDCWHQEKLWNAYKNMEPLIIKLNQGYFFDYMDHHNEITRLMNDVFLSFASSFDDEERAKHVIKGGK